MPFDVVVVGDGFFGKRPDPSTCVKFVRRIYQLRPWVPVVVISDASPLIGLMAQLLASGVRDCHSANVTVADLARSIASHRAGTRPPATYVTSIKRILAYLEEHFSEGLPLYKLAAMEKMSRSHFSRTFHAVAGTSLRNYVRDLRLKRALELFATSQLSLTSVAIESVSTIYLTSTRRFVSVSACHLASFGVGPLLPGSAIEVDGAARWVSSNGGNTRGTTFDSSVAKALHEPVGLSPPVSHTRSRNRSIRYRTDPAQRLADTAVKTRGG